MKSAIEINNLHVQVESKEILKGINLTFEPGKIHVIMGPNGAGKSTLSYALMGHPKYNITQGKILLNGKDITDIPTDQRAKAGLFLSFQYPVEIPGIRLSHFLRTAVNNHREKKLSVLEFQELLKQKMDLLKMDYSFSRRYLNEGFSGGEKKRAEILQLLLLEPKYAILDETDSGLDIDAMKIVAENINLLRQNKSQMGIIIITHYKRFVELLHPDKVSILLDGRIIKEGDEKLINEIDEKGFKEEH